MKTVTNSLLLFVVTSLDEILLWAVVLIIPLLFSFWILIVDPIVPNPSSNLSWIDVLCNAIPVGSIIDPFTLKRETEWDA